MNRRALAVVAVFVLCLSCSSNTRRGSRTVASTPSIWTCSPVTTHDLQGTYEQFVFRFDGTLVTGKALSTMFGSADPKNSAERIPGWGELSGPRAGWTWTLSSSKTTGSVILFALDVQLQMDDDEEKLDMRLNTQSDDLLIQYHASSDDTGDQFSVGHYHCTQ